MQRSVAMIMGRSVRARAARRDSSSTRTQSRRFHSVMIMLMIMITADTESHVFGIGEKNLHILKRRPGNFEL